MDCGTELVLTGDASLGPAPVEPVAPTRSPATRVPEPVAAVVCPDCGEQVRADANGMCPVCGHDFAAPVEIDEAEFFRDPPSLDEVRRRSSAPDGGSSGSSPVGSWSAPHVDVPTPANSTDAAAVRHEVQSATMPLPADRVRSRFRPGTGEQLAVEPSAWLHVEGGQSVFFDGRMVETVTLDVDELLVGRRDPAVGHYPDIDLAHFVHIDRHISRRHARILRMDGRWFVEDLADNDATWLNDRAHVLNRDRAELSDGDRILVSDSIAMVFRTGALA
jgi:predicted component of type VI protein secretion system